MFTSRLFNLGRQLFRPNLLENIASKHTRARQSAFVAKRQKPIEFLKQPLVAGETCKDVVANVNEKLNDGRLFAVVHLCGKQFKVTDGDILVLEGYWQPTTGDRLKLEKVLCVGGEEFSLTGRPLVQPGLVNVEATVIEKTIAHTRTVFKKKRRKQYTNIKFHRSAQTMLRINSITLNGDVNENIQPMPGRMIFQ